MDHFENKYFDILFGPALLLNYSPSLTFIPHKTFLIHNKFPKNP